MMVVNEVGALVWYFESTMFIDIVELCMFIEPCILIKFRTCLIISLNLLVIIMDSYRLSRFKKRLICIFITSSLKVSLDASSNKFFSPFSFVVGGNL